MKRRTWITMAGGVVVAFAVAGAYELGPPQAPDMQPICPYYQGQNDGSGSISCVTPNLVIRAVDWGMLGRLGR